jgi:hypothetical protein
MADSERESGMLQLLDRIGQLVKLIAVDRVTARRWVMVGMLATDVCAAWPEALSQGNADAS